MACPETKREAAEEGNRDKGASETDPKRPRRAPFLNSFNYFRGIAITIIVAGHCFDLADWQGNTMAEKLVFNLVASGGSCLFVFISGFLFHHVFFERFVYRRFLLSKIRNVLSPYLVMSILPIAYFVWRRKPVYDGYFLPDGEGVLNTAVIPAIKYVLTGAVFFPYWYIPFIMLMFVLSPLHVRFIHMDLRPKSALLLLLFGVSLVIHRPVGNLNPIQSLVYYMPIYLLGMTCSIHKEWLYEKAKGKEMWGAMSVFGVLFIQTVLLHHTGNYNKRPFEITGIDWVLLQKAFLCPTLMVFLHRFEDRDWKALSLLATASFGVYFLHAWVLMIVFGIKSGRELGVPFFVLWPVVSALVIGVSAGIAYLMKRLLKRHSRLVVGW